MRPLLFLFLGMPHPDTYTLVPATTLAYSFLIPLSPSHSNPSSARSIDKTQTSFKVKWASGEGRNSLFLSRSFAFTPSNNPGTHLPKEGQIETRLSPEQSQPLSPPSKRYQIRGSIYSLALCMHTPMLGFGESKPQGKGHSCLPL